MFTLYEFGLILFRACGGRVISLLLLHFTVAFPAISYAKDERTYSLEDLDQVLTQRKEYNVLKERKIRDVKHLLDKAILPDERFRLQKAIYKQYINYQLDSALVYAGQMLNTSEAILHRQSIYKMEAMLHTACVYTHTGKYNACAEILESDIFTENMLPDSLKELYFGVQLALNRALFEVVHEREDARIGIQSSVDSLAVYLPSNSIWSAVNLSHKYRAEGDYNKALAVLLDAYPKAVGNEERGTVVYYISLLYSLIGDKEQAKKFYILSAITEIKAREKKVYASLWELAELLYDEGDVERAHRYIEISLQDAIYSGTYRFILKIQQILPRIAQAYNAKITQEKNKVIKGAFVIGGLLVVMVVLVLFVMRQNKKVLKARKETSEANGALLDANSRLNLIGKELHLRNAELQLVNSQLLFLNKELVEMNVVKETYLSKFIDLCAEYIDKLDVYRMNLKRLMQDSKFETVLRELQSAQYIEDEFKYFLSNFDETFLKIYPSFVDEFNRLFPEGEKQALKNNELLNTELRIFALIRLGIKDSNKIAKFLRCSITTVYTYRSKTKNKSLCPDEFEDRIMECSREEVLL
ncbi:hypothetical protein G5B30_02130 [Sphingobacterium sp. SGG-5]|uniref:DUF6377 domain-containing protein n=1 Tax=Sphingobacterium sp. SGG-5 TaxID=2710881 RepID=UPI0013EE3C1C|nr:DUF6377 domain-containing protein [Sphingobacterium sp. SGG-5]NGM60706.1 hypothetical protein [Sphingobacterium sp. SGG-5]